MTKRSKQRKPSILEGRSSFATHVRLPDPTHRPHGTRGSAYARVPRTSAAIRAYTDLVLGGGDDGE